MHSLRFKIASSPGVVPVMSTARNVGLYGRGISDAKFSLILFVCVQVR